MVLRKSTGCSKYWLWDIKYLGHGDYNCIYFSSITADKLE